VTEATASDRSAPRSHVSPHRLRRRRWRRLLWTGDVILIVIVAAVSAIVGMRYQDASDTRRLTTDKTAQIEDLQAQLSGLLQTQLRNVEAQINWIAQNQGLTQGQTAQIASMQDQLSNAKGDLASLQDQLKVVQDALDATKPTRQAQQIEDLKAELAGVQGELKAIMNPDGTADIKANESTYIAKADLIIGLIGTPRQESVELNISGNGIGGRKKQQPAAAGDIIEFIPDPSNPSKICLIKIISFDILKASVQVNATCPPAKT
jgi:hypothetical protein